MTDLLRHSLAHRFSFISAGALQRGQMERRASVSLWPACPVTVSQRRVAIEVAGLAVWAEALPETKLTDEQVPFPLSTLASALPLELGSIGPYRPNSIGLPYCHSASFCYICIMHQESPQRSANRASQTATVAKRCGCSIKNSLYHERQVQFLQAGRTASYPGADAPHQSVLPQCRRDLRQLR